MAARTSDTGAAQSPKRSRSVLTGEAGGGLITLAGSADYSEKPIRYDVTAKTDRIRIRYPEGMSWQVGGALRLWPVFILGRRFSGLVAIQPEHALVTTGI